MTEVIYPPCKKCGASHEMGIETMDTGHIEPLDLCYRCLWEPLRFNLITDQIDFNDTTVLEELTTRHLRYLQENIRNQGQVRVEWGGSARCIVEGESVNMADHLNKLERQNND